MSVIDELWQLQKHHNRLTDIENNIRQISAGNKIKKMNVKLEEMESKLKYLEKNIKANEKVLAKNNIALKDSEYQLGKIEKSLYNENITDLKQLNHLDKERKNIAKEIEDKETEIILQMDKVERLKEEFEEEQKDFYKLRKKYTKIVRNSKSMLEDYKNKAIAEKSRIEKISSSITKDVYTEYTELIRNKKIAVVEVVENRCSGCNMVLPSATIARLKSSEGIFHCENCHRILYLKKYY